MPTRPYYGKSGKRFVSVTTVLGKWGDSGGLIRWAHDLGRRGIDMDVERDRAASIGTMLHAMVEASVAGTDPFDIVAAGTPECAIAERCFDGFDSWLSQSRLTLIESEVPLISEEFEFGGTLDLIMRAENGDLYLGDLKTSNSLHANMIAQLGAYSILYEAAHHGLMLRGAHLLRFSKEDGSSHHHAWPRETLELGREAFLKALELYRLEARLKKAVGG